MGSIWYCAAFATEILFSLVARYRTRPISSRGLYIFYPIFTAVYIVERLILQTIYALKKKILRFLGLKSAVYSRERLQKEGKGSWLELHTTYRLPRPQQLYNFADPLKLVSLASYFRLRKGSWLEELSVKGKAAICLILGQDKWIVWPLSLLRPFVYLSIA